MTYIHPSDTRIRGFIDSICSGDKSLDAVCSHIFEWFDNFVQYSRLEEPFLPLQRSDLDLLTMKAGTCGDYSNFVVSVLSAMGYEMYYAYVHQDCYGDAQDHICAAVKSNGREILIDATLPYRKWCGFNCPHQDYELLAPSEFEQRMKKEEQYWCSLAEKYGNDRIGGLLYAPWIHAETVYETSSVFDNIFYLLSINEQCEPILYVYYQHYTEKESALPIMAVISGEKMLFHFSVNQCSDLWDDEQWSRGFEEMEIPAEHITQKLERLKCSIEKVVKQINGILLQSGCGTIMSNLLTY